MQFHKRFLMLPALLVAMAVGSNAYAQNGLQGHDQECRAGKYNPIVGIWSGNLDFTTLGKATVLVSINQGGTFTETDSVDLDGTVGTASPGYAAWKATDCRHYTLTINKMLYNPKAKQFFKVVLPGTIELSEDGQSWTVNLKQQVFDANGNEVPNLSGTVSGTARRVKAGSDA
ncbi:hypothetical protein [Paraburkholderia sp. ZP32-5]|uniref:hypothetical protein n=1 Tax=Paraburkholderia sp. ZP32-5 TaxID=2883245 RepID=UPI001F286E82|nr:hypothetical protein [Paraburkholderia sp. ZP32-5]